MADLGIACEAMRVFNSFAVMSRALRDGLRLKSTVFCFRLRRRLWMDLLMEAPEVLRKESLEEADGGVGLMGVKA